jgi:RNA polymerase sigma factor (sigma-70 family)
MTVPFNRHVNVALELKTNDGADDALRTLVERAATDASALAELIRLCQPYVTRLCRRHTRSRAEADDLEQEVWLVLIKRVSQINEPAAVYGWLKSVTIRAAIARARKAAREVPAGTTVARPTSTSDANTTSERILREERRQLLRNAMECLQQSDRVLLTLLSAEDRPDYARISQMLDRPLGSIGPTRQRALDRLRRNRAIASLAD